MTPLGRFACLIAALALVSCARTGSETSTLRVMTYNIHYAEGTDGRLDVDRIAAVIRAENPDIVCLQEVDQGTERTGRLDTPALLGAALDMRPFYGPNVDLQGGHYGNLTLTRLPVEATENIKLPTPEGVEPRGALRLSVTFAGRPLDIYNTHFGLKAEQRLAQARKVIEVLDGRADVPTILAGDLNEGGPRGFELHGADPEGKGWEAVKLLFTRFKPIQPGWFKPTFPSTAPRRSIDYVLFTEPLSARGMRIIEDERTRVASDHLPVVMEIIVRK